MDINDCSRQTVCNVMAKLKATKSVKKAPGGFPHDKKRTTGLLKYLKSKIDAALMTPVRRISENMGVEMINPHDQGLGHAIDLELALPLNCSQLPTRRTG